MRAFPTPHRRANVLADAIAPIDLARRPVNLLRRLMALCKNARAHSISMVIGHNDRGTLHDYLLKRFCARHEIRLVSDTFYRRGVNTARLRNEAMRAVTAPLTLLLDADLYVPPTALANMYDAVRREKQPFYILPCLYLSRKGTADLTQRRASPAALLQAYLDFKRAPFLHLALPSSVTLLSTADFQRSGGFDASFSGHGYEDLEFLLRLAWLHSLAPRTPDMLVDCSARAPLLLNGFRGHLARLALPAILNGNVAFHLWHPTARDAYYASRGDNAAYFQTKTSGEIPFPAHSSGSPAPSMDTRLIDHWLELCRRRGVDPAEYSILFDNKPGHCDRLDTGLRRLKFLAGRY